MCKCSDAFSLRVLIGRGLKPKFRLMSNRVSLFNFESSLSTIVGVDGGEGPPVPIPNTEVKLTSADNTLRATAREDR